MDINLQTVKFDADKRLVEFVEKKLAKIDRFAERATGADVILKLDKDAERGNKVVNITVHVPGGDMMTEQRAKSFEEAVDAAVDVLKRQCEKNKERFTH
ncbi:MAG: ribosome-associated translation inhibitor RaiA [Alistipes sp.]|nr:ribosome-associated translation inhibitor RaiA [Alistipes sp.]